MCFLVWEHFLHGAVHGVRRQKYSEEAELGKRGLAGIVQRSLNEPQNGDSTHTEATAFGHKELVVSKGTVGLRWSRDTRE